MDKLHCRLCRRPLFPQPLLVQENMPAAAQELPTASTLKKDQGVTLDLRQCTACGVVQLTAAPVLYWRDVIRAAGVSPEMRAFRLQQFGEWINTHGLQGKSVLEVGCGRGEYLTLLREAGASAFGLEHRQDSVDACLSQGLQVQQGFINDDTCAVKGAPFDGFAILNFLEHIPAAPQTLQGIAANLADGATGLVEVPNFDMIIEKGLFAEFIPDHLFYFTRQTLTTLLEHNGFEVLDCQPQWYGYLLSATVRKRKRLQLNALTRAQARLKEAFDAFLAQISPGHVAIWGAGHQALALISLMQIGERIAYVIDSAPFKQGHFTPATHLPIVAPHRLETGDVDAIIVLAASYSDEVARIIRERYGERFTIAVLRGERLETTVYGAQVP